MSSIKSGKATHKFYHDLNSVTLPNKNKQEENNDSIHEHYSTKLKEIKALRKFEELFKKQKQQKAKKDLETQLRTQSPHQLSNRLKGMFFLKKRLELQEKYKQAYEEECFDSRLLQAKRIPSSIHERKKSNSKLNFIHGNKVHSGKNLNKPVVRRPETRFESTISTYKIFNSQCIVELVLTSNKIKLVQHQHLSFPYLNIYVQDGNNSELIKAMVRKRIGWRVVQSVNVANMIWSQYFRMKLDSRYQRKFKEETKKDDTLKEKTIDQSRKFQNLSKTSVFKVKGRMGGRNQSSNKDQSNMLKAEDYDQQILKICPFNENLNRKKVIEIHSNPYIQIYNHFPNHFCISDKKNLLYNLTQYYELKNQNVFDIVPFTFEVNRDLVPGQLTEKLKNHSYWIVKPGQNSNRGRGIVVCKNFESVTEQISLRFDLKTNNNRETIEQQESIQRRESSNKNIFKGGRRKPSKTDETVIIQQYIQPLLYHKRKFDIRMFLLVTGVKGKIRGYLYNQGYVRTCSKAFTMQNLNKFIHLTNDAIQYRSTDYGKFQEGNKIGWKKFQLWLQSEGYHNFFKNFQQRTKKISGDIISSVQAKLLKRQFRPLALTAQKQYSEMRSSLPENDQKEDKIYFEIFGLDFLIDKTLNVWLIEVNTNPSLNTQCSRVVNNLIPKMVDNAFDISVQPYTRASKIAESSKYENRFEAVFDDQWEDFYQTDLHS